MATFRLRHFSNPQTLRSIKPERLLELLRPYGLYFKSRGLVLPSRRDAAEADYQSLVDIFLTPDDATPTELLDALFLIDEMSTPEAMDKLLDAVKSAGRDLSLRRREDASPADVAVLVWLTNQEILERQHAEQYLVRPRSFTYFQTNDVTAREYQTLTSKQLRQLERELDDWFEAKRRGRGSRVLIYPQEDEIWFLVRHGEPFKREESLGRGGVTSVAYRPLKYDVVVYDNRIGDLRINAQLEGEKSLYREKFGQYFFDDPDCFPGKAKYTLEPLREYGSDALACGDIDGIESIVLTEIAFMWGGTYGEIEIRRADDVFAALAKRKRQLPERARILRAAFKVKFVDSKTPRSVKIRPSNIAEYTRDNDAQLIEQWLKLRGFLLHEDAVETESASLALASA